MIVRHGLLDRVPIRVEARAAPPAGAGHRPLARVERRFEKILLRSAKESGEWIRRSVIGPGLAALRRLGEILVPAKANMPGAKEAETAEVLDFLIYESPA